MGLDAIILLVAVLAGLPLMAWSAKRHLDGGMEFPRSAFYIQSALLQIFLLGWSSAVAFNEKLDLFPRPAVTLADLGWAGLLLAIALGAMRLSWATADEATRRRLLMIVPSTPRERRWWIGVSAAAAMGEEMVFRGVVVILLSKLVGSWLAAAVITAIGFGLAHSVQGWLNSLHVALFGFAFHLLVFATGDLWMAIAVHFVYDVVAGYHLGSRTVSS